TPARFLDLGVAGLRSLGLTRQKAAYCIHLAEEIRAGRLNLMKVARMDDAKAHAALTRIKGIGPWTAGIYLLMALRRPDIWPAGDMALSRTVRRIKGLRGDPSGPRMHAIARAWRPYRSVAARILWRHYLAGFGAPGAGRDRGRG